MIYKNLHSLQFMVQ